MIIRTCFSGGALVPFSPTPPVSWEGFISVLPHIQADYRNTSATFLALPNALISSSLSILYNLELLTADLNKIQIKVNKQIHVCKKRVVLETVNHYMKFINICILIWKNLSCVTECKEMYRVSSAISVAVVELYLQSGTTGRGGADFFLISLETLLCSVQWKLHMFSVHSALSLTFTVMPTHQAECTMEKV